MSVFISDFSLLSSLGCDKELFWENLVSGKKILSDISCRVSSGFPVKQAAIIPEELILPDVEDLMLRTEVELCFTFLLGKLLSGRFFDLEVDGLIWGSGQFGRKLTDFSLQAKESFARTDIFEQNILNYLHQRRIRLPNKRALVGQANACVAGVSSIETAFQKIKTGAWKRALIFVHETVS